MPNYRDRDYHDDRRRRSRGDDKKGHYYPFKGYEELYYGNKAWERRKSDDDSDSEATGSRRKRKLRLSRVMFNEILPLEAVDDALKKERLQFMRWVIEACRKPETLHESDVEFLKYSDFTKALMDAGMTLSRHPEVYVTKAPTIPEKQAKKRRKDIKHFLSTLKMKNGQEEHDKVMAYGMQNRLQGRGRALFAEQDATRTVAAQRTSAPRAAPEPVLPRRASVMTWRRTSRPDDPMDTSEPSVGFNGADNWKKYIEDNNKRRASASTAGSRTFKRLRGG